MRAVSSSLQIPTIVVLIILIAIVIIMLGSFIGEFFTERRTLKAKIPVLIDELQGKNADELQAIIKKSRLLKRQKKAIIELIVRGGYSDATREALARQLIADEENRYAKITKVTDLIAKIAPMFGLMGTLIPLGPGLLALGQGDTKTLSESLLIAFDTTVAGLISAAVAYIISSIRKGWYEQYMVGLETIMETILEEQSRENNKGDQ
ncbi:MAG: MotA/TolQ/ExbB proton channel family protein [Firmicutes bacterium]|nr:MotA/TolQ/ExbB proton channel family protein [Bacillota bacterium]